MLQQCAEKEKRERASESEPERERARAPERASERARARARRRETEGESSRARRDVSPGHGVPVPAQPIDFECSMLTHINAISFSSKTRAGAVRSFGDARVVTDVY